MHFTRRLPAADSTDRLVCHHPSSEFLQRQSTMIATARQEKVQLTHHERVGLCADTAAAEAIDERLRGDERAAASVVGVVHIRSYVFASDTAQLIIRYI